MSLTTPRSCMPPPSNGRDLDDLLPQAIAGVLRLAQDGELPLCAWTLGLSQPAWQRMFHACFPSIDTDAPIPAASYEALRHQAPPHFHALHSLIAAHRATELDPQRADWLARAIAAGCLGSRHLWQDLGLRHRDALSTLLAKAYPSLHAANRQQLKWKRFLFDALGTADVAPDCHRCDDASHCAATRSPSAPRAFLCTQEATTPCP